MERPIHLLSHLHHRKELWKIAVKVKDKWRVLKDDKETMELVVVDAKGDDIVVIVPNELYARYEKDIIEYNTYCFENFQIFNNDDELKLSKHKYKVTLNTATLISEFNVHRIPDPKPTFLDFTNIVTGKWRKDLLYDVIGVLDYITFSQPIKGEDRKVQVNFNLRDLSNNKIQCTLWDDYAMRFFTYTREKAEPGPTIIYMKYAKITAAGKNPLTVSNIMSTTKLFINDNVPEMFQFKQRLDLAIFNGTFDAIVEAPWQVMTQESGESGGSQSKPDPKFCCKCEIMPLSEVINLTTDISVVTVVETIAVKGSKNGWYYQSCVHCPRPTTGDKPPYYCEAGHPTEIKIYKYRLEVDVAYEKTQTTFTFWDRECKQLLNIAAADLRDQTIAAGMTDQRAYPMLIDTIEGKTLVTRVKWNTNTKTASVNGVNDGKEFIAHIISQFPASKDSKQLDTFQSPILQGVSSALSQGKPDDMYIPKICMSTSDDIVPVKASMITPSKRSGTLLLSDKQIDEVKEPLTLNLSSTKVKSLATITKQPKIE